jgi:rubrerythrin
MIVICTVCNTRFEMYNDEGDYCPVCDTFNQLIENRKDENVTRR